MRHKKRLQMKVTFTLLSSNLYCAHLTQGRQADSFLSSSLLPPRRQLTLKWPEIWGDAPVESGDTVIPASPKVSDNKVANLAPSTSADEGDNDDDWTRVKMEALRSLARLMR